MSSTNETSAKWLDSWHVNPSANRDYDFIDGLRGVAILMVLVGHLSYFNPKAGIWVHFIGNLLGGGGQGVQLFFTLSGFLISWPFWKKKNSHSQTSVPTGYARRRFWKIYPPLALSVIVLIPFYIFTRREDSYFWMGIKWLTGLPFLLPTDWKFNPVMWTLVLEVQFYALLPVLFLLLKRMSYRSCLWFMAFIFVLVPLAVQFATGWHPTFYPEINSHFPAGIDSFSLGVLLAGLESMGIVKKQWASFGIVGLGLWLLALLGMAWNDTAFPNGNETIYQTIVWVERFASVCLLCYIADIRHPIAQILCNPLLRWCGIISYEWYLIHQPIILWLRNIIGSAGANPIKYAAILGSGFFITVAIAALMYRYFSLPILKFGRSGK